MNTDYETPLVSSTQDAEVRSSDGLTTEEANLWEEMWYPHLRGAAREAGRTVLVQMKIELADYWRMLDHVPVVYMAVTDGRVSKPNTHANEVIGEFEDRFAPVATVEVERKAWARLMKASLDLAAAHADQDVAAIADATVEHALTKQALVDLNVDVDALLEGS